MKPIARTILGVIATVMVLWGLLVPASAQAPGRAGAGDAMGVADQLLPPQDKAAIIRLDAEVDDMMLRSIKRRVEVATHAGCSLIIFEMDTPGGLVSSALDISKYIKEIVVTKKLTTVAWVHHDAYSGGAMITAACQYVVMSSQGTYGLCAPIAVAPDGRGGQQLVLMPAAERAKMEDWIFKEFDDSARANGWNRAVLKAMVSVEAQVHEMHNDVTQETRFVDDAGKTELLANEEQLPDGHKASPWKYVGTVDDAKNLLLANATDALRMKISQATVDDETRLKGVLNIRGDMIVLPFSWAERATVYLTTWAIRMFLFAGLVVFGILEFSHPGVSVFGIMAVLCLVLLVGAPFLTGLAQVWEIALIVVGVAIIVADLLAFGGIGLLAVPGFILMALGLIASFIPLEADGSFLSSHASWIAAEKGLGMVVCGTFLGAAAFWALTKYIYLTPGFNRLQLAPGGSPGSAAAALATGSDAVRDSADRPAGDAVFVGALGVATTDLRPVGKARFGEHLVSVVSHGNFINMGTEVEVLEVRGIKIVVRPHVTPVA